VPRDISDPANLTEKQRAFAAAYLANGGDATHAYRQVYDCRNMNPSSIHVEASNLTRHPGVVKLTGKAVEHRAIPAFASENPADLNKTWLLTETMRAYNQSMRAGQPGAAKNLLELMGKLTGILVERKELRLIRSVEDLSDEELASITGSRTIDAIADDVTEG
jgi:hypothetical protein